MNSSLEKSENSQLSIIRGNGARGRSRISQNHW